MVDSPEFLFIEEVAQRFRVPTSTVRHWLVTRKLRSVRPGRRRLIHRDELKRFCESLGAGESVEVNKQA